MLAFKQHLPANDLLPRYTQQMSCVDLRPQRRGLGKYVALIAAALLFIASSLFASLPPATQIDIQKDFLVSLQSFAPGFNVLQLAQEEQQPIMLSQPAPVAEMVSPPQPQQAETPVVEQSAQPVQPDPIVAPQIVAEQPVHETPSPVAAEPVAAPYDITVNASSLAQDAQQKQVDTVMQALPTDASSGDTVVDRAPAPKPSPRVLDIAVKDVATVTPSPALMLEAQARDAEMRGDLVLALRLQYRLAARYPDNMVYRMQLAVLYDRTGDAANAAMLYRQIVDAQQAQDPTLPAILDIASIQNRIAYLQP